MRYLPLYFMKYKLTAHIHVEFKTSRVMWVIIAEKIYFAFLRGRKH